MPVLYLLFYNFIAEKTLMTAAKTQRYLALDIFRGMTIAFMLMVNNNGPNPFEEMEHADWHGFTLTDLVFPSFLFAVGLALSFAKARWETMTQQAVVSKILKRTFLIFLFGYLMYWFPFVAYNSDDELIGKPMSQTRIFGVLQRIALCYGVVALLVYYTNVRTMILTAAGLLLFYWTMMDGWGDLSQRGNFASWVDMKILSPAHMYRNGKDGYDACGILGTLPAIVNTIAGYLCGLYIKNNRRSFEVLAKIAMTGFLLVGVAYFWEMVFPFNKKIWTSSYTLLCIGLDCLIIACLIYIVDFLNYKKWGRVFEVFGKNALFIYLLAELLPRALNLIRLENGKGFFSEIQPSLFGSWLGNGHAASFFYSLFIMVFYWFVCYLLDKKRIYIKI